MPRTRTALRTAAIGATGTVAVAFIGTATPASATAALPGTGCSVSALPPTGSGSIVGSTISGNGTVVCDSWYTGSMTISNQLKKYANGKWTNVGEPVSKSFWGGAGIGESATVPCAFAGQNQFKTVTTATANNARATDTSSALSYTCT
ncbi:MULTISPECIES: hypothetical protein [Frankia]|uniref:Ig-like domain-containing protein n=1 Tax=Frankia umida TaxID=573489 RepID=A0ABT0JRZ7_9ACTN|nr:MULTISPECIES: hypothetical protein [Frankia]MCK9874301.1 hypothetical protein [Frankia umida]